MGLVPVIGRVKGPGHGRQLSGCRRATLLRAVAASGFACVGFALLCPFTGSGSNSFWGDLRGTEKGTSVRVCA